MSANFTNNNHDVQLNTEQHSTSEIGNVKYTGKILTCKTGTTSRLKVLSH